MSTIHKFNLESEYLTEAKVSAAKLNRAVQLYVKLIEKYRGIKLYRYGGNDGIVEIKGGIGILYISARGPAYQFNYKNGEIHSITIWNKFNFKKGDFTITLDGIGLLKAGQRLIKFVINPRPGKYVFYANPEIHEDVTEGYTEYLFETRKKRIKPVDFFNVMKGSLSAGQNIESMSWDEISIVAAGAGVQVPTIVRTLKVAGTKGYSTRYDLTKIVRDDTIRNADTGGTEIPYHLTITKRDPNTNKFMSPKGDKEVGKMIEACKQVLIDPNVEKEIEDPNSLFGKMEALVRLIGGNHIKSLIVYGGAGTGKTFTVKKTLADLGIKKDSGWFLLSGNISTASLYKHLFMHRKGHILVFDDTDSVWKDATAANILKAALNTSDERIISWHTARTVNISLMSKSEKKDFFKNVDHDIRNDPESAKFPSEFEYDGRIIFITNLDANKLDAAVLSRSARIDMTLTVEQMFSRLKTILPTIGDPKTPLKIKEEIFDYLLKEHGKGLLKSVTMRSFVKAEAVYNSGEPDWRILFHHL